MCAMRQDWVVSAFTEAASLTAYSIVIWTMSVAPIAFVAALRGTSILFAMLIGWLLFKDKMGWLKLMAGLLIVGGVVLPRF